MVASIGVVASPSQGVSYYQRDGYYAKEDPAHLEASAWAGKGADVLGLSGPVDPDTFQAILEGKVPGGPQLGRRGKEGEIEHRPGRDVTLSAPKSVSLVAMVGGDERIVEVHDRAVRTTLGWIEKNAVLTRMQDGATGAMVHAGDQKTVVATFRHDTSRNLDPQLHTHCVIANMAQGGDNRWRTMVNDGLYRQQKAISAIYRAELAEGVARLAYELERTHADGRFEIAGIPREVIEAFSTRRAEIEAAMKDRGFDDPSDNKRLADRAALMTRAVKRDVNKGALRQVWDRQAQSLGFSPDPIMDRAAEHEPETSTWEPASREALLSGEEYFVTDAVNWAVEHLSERQAVFSHADLLAAALSQEPGSATAREAEWAIEALERDGKLHGAIGPEHGSHWATEAAVAREWETVERMREGKNAGERLMRRWVATAKLHRGRLNEGQKEAVRLLLSSTDRIVGVQGYAGTGKTTMLDRFRSLAESAGYRVKGLAPSASAARTLGRESGIRSETLQRYLTLHAGVVEGRATPRSLRELRAAQARTVLVEDESSLASSEQMRGLLRIATALRLPRVALVGDEKQLDGVEAGKPFAQLKSAGMETAVMSSSSRERISEPSCSRCSSRMPGMSLSAARSSRCTCASKVLTKPQRRFARSSASCVPSGAACARMRKACVTAVRASPSSHTGRLSNSSGPGVAPKRAACSQTMAVKELFCASWSLCSCMILSLWKSFARSLSPNVMPPIIHAHAVKPPWPQGPARGVRGWCGRTSEPASAEPRPRASRAGALALRVMAGTKWRTPQGLAQ